MSPALDAVRARTRAAHARLEGRLRLTGGDATRARYRAYLGCMLGVCDAVARATRDRAGVRALLPDADARARAKGDGLRADLVELGADPRALAARGAPPLPPMDDDASLLGVLYVVEGSTLGGAVLAREVERALPGAPTRYLRAYGDDLGTKWRAFCAAIERAGDEPRARETMAARAAEAFSAVERWLDDAGLLREVHHAAAAT